ncbi:MAG TPA: nitric oxide synthase oxygenase [Alphaproteobacteria bacterium]|nr:nitric oxide synthase oxygenase [Alphaproteobacteria bacterium]
MEFDTRARSSPLHRRLRRLGYFERLEEAEDFINRFHTENALSETARRSRIAEIRRSFRKTGTYEHTPEELAFGARVAWRHHSRCIGRLFWPSLEVVDCRHVTDPDEMAAWIFSHLGSALRDGRIRSMITVFAPMQRNEPPPYVESMQITQYAGYASEDGNVLGDRQNIEATRIATSLGWRPMGRPGPFDLLPVIMRDRQGRRLIYEVPRSTYKEIEIRHPHRPELNSLNLRWYAVPLVSGMIMSIGGIDYPCAPFNGFYMGTEIASRDFADPNRYDLLREVAFVLGEDPDRQDTDLWRDRTLTELNSAVLASFRRENVTIVDHYTASEQYMEFDNRERAAGRCPSGDWAWVTPPQASAACRVFHLPMQDLHAVPNFYHSRAVDGHLLRPSYDYTYRPRWKQRLDGAKRRYRNWRRRET